MILLINGMQLSKTIPHPSHFENDKGSIITILATDLPLSERQLKRICKRTVVGLSRMGSYMSNGSGEIVIAFSTTNRIPHYPKEEILSYGFVHDSLLNNVFRGVAEVVEESVLSSMLHAETVTGKYNRQLRSLAELLER